MTKSTIKGLQEHNDLRYTYMQLVKICFQMNTHLQQSHLLVSINPCARLNVLDREMY